MTLTPSAFGSNIKVATCRVKDRESTEPRSLRFDPVTVASLRQRPVRGPLRISKPNPRCHVVDMLLNVLGDVIALGRDVMATRSVLVDVVLGIEYFFRLIRRGIKLNPL